MQQGAMKEYGVLNGICGDELLDFRFSYLTVSYLKLED
jgi:hypothetical protein